MKGPERGTVEEIELKKKNRKEPSKTVEKPLENR